MKSAGTMPADVHGFRSEMVGDSGLFHDLVGGMPRSDAAIHRKFRLSDRAVPDFMITFPLAIKTAAILLQLFLYRSGKVSHK
nr:hypothetical protein [Chromobacterium subtsugae]